MFHVAQNLSVLIVVQFGKNVVVFLLVKVKCQESLESNSLESTCCKMTTVMLKW